jgi:Domain of unknown function (DUF4190)
MAILGRPSEADERRAAAWRDWLVRQHPLAVAAFVLGAISLTHAGTLLVDGIAAVVLGALALARLRRPGADSLRDRGRGLAWGGIVLGAVSLVIAAYLYSLPAAATTMPR